MTTPNLPPRPASGSSLRPIEESDLTGYGAGLDFEGDGYDLSYEDYEEGIGDRFRAMVGRFLVRVGWLVLAAGFAFGSAGIVAAWEKSPSSGSRPELTWGADQALSTRLDAAIRDLARLNSDVDSLGQQARKTLSSLSQVNRLGLQQAWDSGWNDVTSIDAGAAGLSGRLNCRPWDDALQAEMLKTYSSTMVDRYHSACVAVGAVSPLHDDWQAIVDGSQTAIQVANDIETHDSAAADALQFATQGRYPEALTSLSGASDAIADATTIAVHLADVSDVSALTSWLSLTTQMDIALRRLWQAMVTSKGQVTAPVTAALLAVNVAKANLPDSNSVLVFVLDKMAVNLITYGRSIETAKGALTDALNGLVGGTVVGG